VNHSPLFSPVLAVHWARWEHPIPKPCYLFALVASELSSIDDTFTTRSGRSVTLRLLAKPSDLPKCAWAMESLKQAMAWDEKRFGREYDMSIFHIVAISSFSMGAMENSSLNVFNIKYVLADEKSATDIDFSHVQAVVGHEYFHNWSGNRVTCRDWFQLSLKEGFTVFRDQEFTCDMSSRVMKRISDVDVLRAVQFAEASGPMSHSVRPASATTINNYYSVTVYNGGAEVVRMYSTILGRAAFRRGTDNYFSTNDGLAVTCDHFCSALEEANWDGLPDPVAAAERAEFRGGEDTFVDPPFSRAGPRPLTQFRRWYAVAGTPEVKATVTFDPSAKTITLTMTQTVPPTPKQECVKPALHIPVAVGFLGADGSDIPLKLRDDPHSWSSVWGKAMLEVPPGAPESDREHEIYPGNTVILHLTEPTQTFVFEDVDFTPPSDPMALTSAGLPVPMAPVPSILRGFSAPVRMHLEGDSTAARLFRLAHDADPFNRFEAANLIATDLITSLVPPPRAAEPAASSSAEEPVLAAGAGEAALTQFCDAVRHMLRSATAVASDTLPAGGAAPVDPALVAHILSLPPYKSLIQECSARDGGVADPRAVIAARNDVSRALSKALFADLAEAYSACSTTLEAASLDGGESSLMSKENKARRALRNASLALLMTPAVQRAKEASKASKAAGGDDEAVAEAVAASTTLAAAAQDGFSSTLFDVVEVASAQQAAASNMTDEYGAFIALCRLPVEHPARKAAVDAFYGKWKGDSLVEDKWLSALAMTGNAASVTALQKHPAYDLLVPNKVYSLVRTFCEGNPREFHAADGSGYDVLADCVGALDAHNPQVASRVAQSFTSGRSLPPSLATVMKARVDRLLAGSPSRDLTEVLSRCQSSLESASTA
jgi:aminopeptidase N